jgi:hypothetical protein
MGNSDAHLAGADNADGFNFAAHDTPLSIEKRVRFM